MVPNAAVTADVPDPVRVNPLASVCNRNWTELATVMLTAMVPEDDVADAVPTDVGKAISRTIKNAMRVFMGLASLVSG